MRNVYFILFSILFIQCNGQQVINETPEAKKTRQEAIIQEHVYDCADKINYTSRMQEYQACLDAGLKKDSTIAYLWQQKAMPYLRLESMK